MTYKTIKMCCFIILSRSEIVELPECTIQTQYNENKLEWVYLLILVKDSDTFLTHNENITDYVYINTLSIFMYKKTCNQSIWIIVVERITSQR